MSPSKVLGIVFAVVEEKEGEGEEEGEDTFKWVVLGGDVSATAVKTVPPIEHTTPAIFHQLNCSWPARTAIANVNIPDVALITVFEVTDVIPNDMLYKPLAINHKGMTIQAARNVGPWYKPLM